MFKGGMGNIMKQAQQLQDNMQKAQEEIANMEVVGEAGAGMVIARMLEREGVKNHIIVVTRWYGGKHLGGDRFRHVQTAVKHYLAKVNP